MQELIDQARAALDEGYFEEALRRLNDVLRGRSLSRSELREIEALLDLFPVASLETAQNEEVWRLRNLVQARQPDRVARAQRAAMAREERRRAAAAASTKERADRKALARRLRKLQEDGMSEADARAVVLHFREGPYAVILTGVVSTALRLDIEHVLEQLAIEPTEARRIVDRAIHIAPETLISGIAQEDAIELKIQLERAQARVRVGPGARVQKRARRSIPEQVRNEVWRRDGGQCVDCGSRERLEFDHIIPISEGGSNTARNIELRCQEHNRQKAARI